MSGYRRKKLPTTCSLKEVLSTQTDRQSTMSKIVKPRGNIFPFWVTMVTPELSRGLILDLLTTYLLQMFGVDKENSFINSWHSPRRHLIFSCRYMSVNAS